MLAAALTLLTGCPPAPPPMPEPDTTALQPEEPEEIPVYLTVMVEQENLRASPNGEKVGEASRSEKLELMQRRGNWFEVAHPGLGTVFIWAPSVGAELINELDIQWLIGGDDYRSMDSLVAMLGEPSSLERQGGDLVEAVYYAQNEDGTLLLGTRRFTSLQLLFDRETKAVLEVLIKLPPYEGDVEGLLQQIGLSHTRPSGSDFERVRFQGKYGGIALLDLERHQGDFTRFSRVHALKFPPGRWRTSIEITTKDADHSGAATTISLGMKNTSPFEFTGPVVKLGVYEETRIVGNWTLGPGDLRLSPGETSAVRFPLPDLGPDANPREVSFTAELKSMTEVPVTQ